MYHAHNPSSGVSEFAIGNESDENNTINAINNINSGNGSMVDVPGSFSPKYIN